MSTTSSSTEATASAAAPSLPPAGTWEIDPTHSNVQFVVRHALTRMRGRFREFSGTITVAEPPERSSATVEIAAASIDTDRTDRDNHLRSPDFLDAERYPALRFRSTGLRPLGGNRFALDGELTIRDVTKPVTLEAEYLGWVKDPWGEERASFAARTEINREDFGLTWNLAMETGGFLVGRTVQIELEVEAVRPRN